MKITRITLLLVLMILSSMILMPAVTSVEPSQQYNKIFLNPFYRQSMDAEDYEYTVEVTPPDGFSHVDSAIVTFQIWINPTIEFFLLVNGQQCNTPSYEVHTTYASAGEGTIFFDCSNVITEAGTYTITLTPDDDTGASTAWLDITYTNDPNGDLDVLGTEYSPGDPGTIFLQLKNSQGLPVLDGACYLDVFSPLINGTHPYYLSDAPMIFDGNDDGLYYYDLTVPETLGNYMLSAQCSYSFDNPLWIYSHEDAGFPNETRISSGTWSGNPIVLNDKADGLYEKCTASSGTQGCLTTFGYTLPEGDYNNVTINVYYSGQADRTRLMNLACMNVSDGTYIDFINQLIYTGDATGTTPTQIDDFVTNILPQDCMNLSLSAPEVLLQFYVNTNGINVYHNWLSLLALTTTGNIQDLKGSSEMHVTDVARASSLLTAPQVWNFTNRSLTNVTNIIEGVWNYSNRSLTNVTNIIEGVWNYTNRTLTYYPQPNNLTEGDVWEYWNRTLTYYPEPNNLTAGDVWDYLNRTLTYYPAPNNLTAGDIWTYYTRNLTYTPPYPSPNNLTAEDVWTYLTRNLTYYPEQLDLTNYTQISQDVWSYTTRILTFYPANNTATATAVWNYTGRYTQGEII